MTAAEAKAKAKKILEQGLARMGISLPDPTAMERLSLYCDELLKWNRKVNLVAREATRAEILEKHFLDSLTLLPLLREEHNRRPSLLDVGSGAGFPGLVLKIAWPGLVVTLVEPRRKRAFFLRHLIRTLGLEGIKVLRVRLAEGAEPDPLAGQRFDLITSRALADLATFLALVAPYLRPAGRIIAMKGPRGTAELDSLGKNPAWPLISSRTWQLPFSKGQRLLLVFGGGNNRSSRSNV
ncbi:MAG: 16S rRNA (guanine(527)-N(7))-methyltransferase RsmG [Desulfobacterales bacterium]|nr:16S rRNA (guanine(527)-N(7))-methyltransferase RsmG [Desulfobacterales bacterium]